MTIRVAAYTRVSTEKQATEEKVSLGEQRTDIETLCAFKGYEIVEWYQDIGSGASKNRKDFKRMLKDAMANEFDMIVCWKSDRLSRGMFPAAALMEAIQGTPIQLEAVKDAIDLNTFGLLAAVGAIELENIRERVRMGMRGKVKAGTRTGTPKYGYVLKGAKGKKKARINEDEAVVVRRIFEEYASGRTVESICKGLNDDGIPTAKGRTWWDKMTWRVISDSAYIGESYYGKRHYVKRSDGDKDIRHTVWDTEDNWIKMPYPPIVSMEVFDAAQRVRKRNAGLRKKTGRYAQGMLSGLVWCGNCGTRFAHESSASYYYYTKSDGTKTRKKYPNAVRRRYVCLGGGHRHQEDCPRKRVGAVTLEGIVLKAVREFLDNPTSKANMVESRRKDLEDDGSLKELERAQGQLDKMNEATRRIHNLYTWGEIDETEVELRLKGVRERSEMYEEQVARLKAESGNVEQTSKALDDFIANADGLMDSLDSLDDAKRAEAMQHALDKVVVTGNEVQVVLALGIGVLEDGLPT